jgi:hypothetical protein
MRATHPNTRTSAEFTLHLIWWVSYHNVRMPVISAPNPLHLFQKALGAVKNSTPGEEIQK